MVKYRLSGKAFSQLDEFLENGYTSPKTFTKCVLWERNLWKDLKNMTEWDYNNAIPIGNNLYQLQLYFSETIAIFNISQDNMNTYLLVVGFIFPSLLESKQNRNIKDLEEFHSWMKRLDEVKGARPTYWCQ